MGKTVLTGVISMTSDSSQPSKAKMESETTGQRIGPQQLSTLLKQHGRGLEVYAAQWSQNPEECVQEMTSEEVERMAVGQVLSKDAKRGFLKSANLLESIVYLSPVDKERRAKEVEVKLKKNETELVGFGQIIASMLLPAAEQVIWAQLRIERDMDALMVTYALRMRAAEAGRFPEKLSDISVVPVPDNPATGKPLEYRLDAKQLCLCCCSSCSRR